MIKSEWSYVNKWAKKIKAINYLGGKCIKCGETDIFKLQFHHKDNKTKDRIYDNTKAYQSFQRWSIIEKELNKCVLLCGNCHIEEHYDYELKNRDRKNKEILLEFKNIFKCEKCGYDKCNKVLEFHHKVNKEFSIGSVTNIKRWKSISDIEDYIKNELLKCNILCSNCHQLEHIDIEKFKRLENEIIENSKNLRTNRKANVFEIMNMFNNSFSKHAIARNLEIPISTVCSVIKRNGGKIDIGSL